MDTEMQEIKVLVPRGRTNEFYRWFADWSEGTDRPAKLAELTKPATVEVDVNARTVAAARWWASLKPSERGIWGMWVDAAPKMLSADDIVEQLGLKGARDIPGILSWSGRKGKKVGFHVNWLFEYDAVSGDPMYGLRDVDDLTVLEYAEVLRQARESVEG